jgi:hypothetical protein
MVCGGAHLLPPTPAERSECARAGSPSTGAALGPSNWHADSFISTISAVVRDGLTADSEAGGIAHGAAASADGAKARGKFHARGYRPFR